MYAGVAQSVVQLIRNQQVVCSSHITSSIKALRPGELFCFVSFGNRASFKRNDKGNEKVSFVILISNCLFVKNS